MAVIDCDRCKIGVHYTDVCPGGANGYPRKTKEQMRKEQTQINLGVATIVSAAVILAVLVASI